MTLGITLGSFLVRSKLEAKYNKLKKIKFRARVSRCSGQHILYKVNLDALAMVFSNESQM